MEFINGVGTLNGTHGNGSAENPSDDFFQGYSTGLLNFATTACIVFMLVGVPGNLITIIALARCKKVRNATAVFIINLSLSDLLFCCFNLPLQASTFWHRQWTHGDLLCRLFPMLRYGLLAVSLFSILAITINRYVMIGHPRHYPRIYRRHYLGVMVISTWLLPFGCLLPTWQGIWGTFGLDLEIYSCSILPDHHGHSPKEFLFILAFCLPCLSIIICYARIFYIVRKTAIRSHEPIVVISNSTLRIPQQNDIPQPIKTAAEHNIEMKLKEIQEKIDMEVAKNELGDKMVTRGGDVDVERKLLSNKNHINVNENPMNNDIDNDTDDELEQNISQRYRRYLSKTEDFKFIDTSLESDLPPTIQSLRIPAIVNHNPAGVGFGTKKNSASSTSINKTVEFSTIPDNFHKLDSNRKNVVRNGCGDVDEDDSACEVSTTSLPDNIQQYKNQVDDNNQLHAIQVDQSSSSGVDMLNDDASPQPKKRAFTASLRRSTRFKSRNKNNDMLRKLSTAASGASILIPGRMTTKDRRLLKMILVIFISFLICYLPITISKIHPNARDIHFLNLMSYILIYLSTCINPIIYVVMSSEYRQAYRNLLLCRIETRGGYNNHRCRDRQRT